jgi:flagellin
LLQTADGALSQVSTLLNRAVTLATEASTSGLTSSQATALQNEYQAIQDEVDQINTNTNFNGQNVFQVNDVAFVGDGTSGAGTSTIDTDLTATTVTASALGLVTNTLTTTAGAEAALTALAGSGGAIDTIAAFRGTIGASINRLTAANNVMTNQVTNLQSAQNSIQDADIAKTVANMTQYNVLQSTGISSLQQSNQAQQAVLKLIQ